MSKSKRRRVEEASQYGKSIPTTDSFVDTKKWGEFGRKEIGLCTRRMQRIVQLEEKSDIYEAEHVNIVFLLSVLASVATADDPEAKRLRESIHSYTLRIPDRLKSDPPYGLITERLGLKGVHGLHGRSGPEDSELTITDVEGEETKHAKSSWDAANLMTAGWFARRRISIDAARIYLARHWEHRVRKVANSAVERINVTHLPVQEKETKAEVKKTRSRKWNTHDVYLLTHYVFCWTDWGKAPNPTSSSPTPVVKDAPPHIDIVNALQTVTQSNELVAFEPWVEASCCLILIVRLLDRDSEWATTLRKALTHAGHRLLTVRTEVPSNTYLEAVTRADARRRFPSQIDYHVHFVVAFFWALFTSFI